MKKIILPILIYSSCASVFANSVQVTLKHRIVFMAPCLPTDLLEITVKNTSNKKVNTGYSSMAEGFKGLQRGQPVEDSDYVSNLRLMKRYVPPIELQPGQEIIAQYPLEKILSSYDYSNIEVFFGWWGPSNKVNLLPVNPENYKCAGFTGMGRRLYNEPKL